jgi:choline dehydrogenase-like flavoprotein
VTGALVTRLVTSASGREVVAVEATIRGSRYRVSADVVVIAAGAINSAVLLLRSANDKHPDGLANRSGMVGRHFMKHHNGAIVAVSSTPNLTEFQKTMAVNDFYWGEDGFPFPMGHVQLLGKVNKDMLAADAPPFAPAAALDSMARHSVDWWLTAEDLPHPENRVRLDGERIVLEYTDHGTEGFDRLMDRWRATLRSVDEGGTIFPNTLYFRRKIPLQAVGHQCGTARFGVDPKSSVLDPFCRAHEVDNLYVVDGSFFPSSAAVNPSLTIMANALRVGDHLIERLR